MARQTRVKSLIDVDPYHKKVYIRSREQLWRRTLGEKLADKVAVFGGSWKFLIMFSGVMAVWIAFNFLTAPAFDPYPFILLNLVLSTLAAIQAPVIMMSQNRAARYDRMKAERDLAVDRKAEMEIQDMQADLDEIKGMITEFRVGAIKLEEGELKRAKINTSLDKESLSEINALKKEVAEIKRMLRSAVKRR